MKVFVLDTGYLETDASGIISGESGPIRLPVMAFLIQTDDGYILFDTGCRHDSMDGYWSPKITNSYTLVQTPAQRLEAQLALCGVTPEEISAVVLSHLHFDHTGGLYLFPHAKVYAPRADFTVAQTRVRINPDPFTHGGYCRRDMDSWQNVFTLCDQDFDLCPGVRVVQLPGHTPGLMGLMVTLADQTLLLPQDCVYTTQNFGPPVRRTGSAYNWDDYHASIEKLRALAEQTGGTILFAHDWAHFQTVRKAPDFYA